MGIYIWNDCGRGAAEIDREFYFLDTRSHALTYTAKREAHWGYRPRSFDRLGFACNHLRWRLYNLCAIGSARNGLFFALQEQNMCLNWKGNRLLPRSVTSSSERSVLEGSFVLQRCLIVLLARGVNCLFYNILGSDFWNKMWIGPDGGAQQRYFTRLAKNDSVSTQNGAKSSAGDQRIEWYAGCSQACAKFWGILVLRSLDSWSNFNNQPSTVCAPIGIKSGFESSKGFNNTYYQYSIVYMALFRFIFTLRSAYDMFHCANNYWALIELCQINIPYKCHLEVLWLLLLFCT